MISCNTFRKKLYDYIDGSVTGDIRHSMDEHIENCMSCRSIYKEEMNLDELLREEINSRDIKFESSREEIMKSINGNRYKGGLLKKLYLRLKKNFIPYTISTACIILIALISINFYKSYNLAKGLYGKGNTINTVTDNPAKETTSHDNPLYKLNEQEIPVTASGVDENINNILNKIKNQSVGVAPWQIGYADDDRIIYYNYSALLAYNFDAKGGYYYGGIDLEKINCGHVQGSVVTNFKFSPDAKYVVINNGASELDIRDKKYEMYLYDFSNRNLKVISKENKFMLQDAWSKSSRFYAFGDLDGSRLFIYDTLKGTSRTLPFKKGTVEDIFVSDDGDILVMSKAYNSLTSDYNVYVLKNRTGYKLEQINIPGTVLEFNKGSILYFKDGTVFQYTEENTREIRSIGTDYNIMRLTESYVIFSNSKQTVVYDYDKNFCKYNLPFNNDYNIEFSPDLQKCLVLDYNNPRILLSNNTAEIELKLTIDFAGEYKWLNNNSLVRVGQKNDSIMLKDLGMYKLDIIPDK